MMEQRAGRRERAAARDRTAMARAPVL